MGDVVGMMVVVVSIRPSRGFGGTTPGQYSCGENNERRS